MPNNNCTVQNTGDLPLCITDPDSGEVYCIMPGFSHPAHTSWPDVLNSLRTPGRARLGPAPDGNAPKVVAG
jgi:hypothetical protein